MPFSHEDFWREVKLQHWLFSFRHWTSDVKELKCQLVCKKTLGDWSNCTQVFSHLVTGRQRVRSNRVKIGILFAHDVTHKMLIFTSLSFKISSMCFKNSSVHPSFSSTFVEFPSTSFKISSSCFIFTHFHPNFFV